MPFRRHLERIPGVTGYDSLDVEAAGNRRFVHCQRGAHDAGAGRIGPVLRSEVLEHVPDPWSGLQEIHRVLRPRGVLLLSVPFSARLHEEPHDYFRYTEHALRAMLTSAGFGVEEIVVIGSVFGFLGHQISSPPVPATFGLPVLGQLAFGLNAVAVVLPCRILDRILPARRRFPLGYVLVAHRL